MAPTPTIPRRRMPASAARTAANRANALRSTGPRTATGKAASAANATTHGLTAERVLLPGEDPADFSLHDTALRAAINPRCAVEHLLLDDLVATTWRLRRVPAIEAGLLALGTSSPTTRAISAGDSRTSLALSWLEGAQTLGLLSRYEMALVARSRRTLADIDRHRGGTA